MRCTHSDSFGSKFQWSSSHMVVRWTSMMWSWCVRCCCPAVIWKQMMRERCVLESLLHSFLSNLSLTLHLGRHCVVDDMFDTGRCWEQSVGWTEGAKESTRQQRCHWSARYHSFLQDGTFDPECFLPEDAQTPTAVGICPVLKNWKSAADFQDKEFWKLLQV